ncbi:oligoribonuclease, mitochondrial isoform X2 [Venturia canescens]|nr:oligoribonuclease, mitochondrial isoform X2 [Venturia canescens]XP_043275958.1 oligoribonuclease, mitochondrial isoform X2 [Venturia canescens]XP_043275959.1 oligoribonuclease, mitochondrial isoform X2 [Venturia canescens]
MSDHFDDKIVWMDMEMTGLELDTCHILEVACLVTDSKLNVISDEFSTVIHQPDDVLACMGKWCREQHEKAGLTEASRKSKISLKSAETDLLKFVKTYVPEKKCPLAGNSVYMDRMFLAKYMPTVDQYLHYRIIDISSIKELNRRWNYQVYKNAPKKSFKHRAIDDIRESIKELQYYKENFFKISDP